MKYWLALLLALQCAFSSFAADAPDLAEDPVVEQRLVVIAEDLRCLVCQNESLPDRAPIWPTTCAAKCAR